MLAFGRTLIYVVEVEIEIETVWATKSGRQTLRRDAPAAGTIAFNFGVRGEIADVIAHVKFYVNRFKDFGVPTP